MEFLYGLLIVFGLLCAFAEHVRSTAEQLLLPFRDLIGVHIVLLDEFSHRQIASNGIHSDFGFEFRRMIASWSFHGLAPERYAHHGGTT